VVLKNTSPIRPDAEAKNSDASSGCQIRATIHFDWAELQWDFWLGRRSRPDRGAGSECGGYLGELERLPHDGMSGTLSNAEFAIQYTTSASFSRGIRRRSARRCSDGSHRHDGRHFRFLGRTVFSGLIPGGTYYFRLWTRDDVGRNSGLSNAASGMARASRIVAWRASSIKIGTTL